MDITSINNWLKISKKIVEMLVITKQKRCYNRTDVALGLMGERDASEMSRFEELDIIPYLVHFYHKAFSGNILMQ